MTDDLQNARTAGRRLGLDLIRDLAPTGPGMSQRLATIQRITATNGSLTADLTMAGGTLHAIPVTTTCARARPGDRVLVTTYGRQSYVTGILARTGAAKPLFSWSSTWEGTPAMNDGDRYEEKHETTTCGGLIHCEIAACISGEGEYGMEFTFTDPKGTLKAHWSNISPQKRGGTMRWTTTGSVYLPYDTYDIRLNTYKYGSMSISTNGNSDTWKDAEWGTNGVCRYARLTIA
ncbi:hypothetical protein [Bifidobacterium callimiconis]|uniref:Uncharacterized protein n=1 Tax=Bifidobacterium callimiconis TaxID=2306973 RepID=A0A430FIC2_9BIFI|nr:hypothetical protein [Bifidobacterium callimiconis]RSX52645.1 hypothetical protein D2E23_0373 [Bifidobacterium callimiconis]